MNLSYYSDFKNYNEALKNLRNHTLHFYQLIIDLRNLISFDIIQGKFDLDKNEYFKNIHPENYNEMKFIHESSLETIFKIKGIFDFLLFPNEKFDKKKFYDVIQLFINELIYYNFNSRINQIFIKNKDTNSSKTFHNSINRNNSIEQQVNYDKLLKKKRKESIDCKKINSLDNEINDLKEKESDDEINIPEVNND